MKLKHKILLFWLLSIVATLGLVGIIFGGLVTQLHEDNSKQQLNNAFRNLHAYLQYHEKQIIADARLLASRKDIVASSNLIENYQNTQSYEKTIFDVEKKRLITEFHELIGGGDLSLIAHYDNDGRLNAFYYMGADGKTSSGFVSYRGGKPVFMLDQADGGQYTASNELPAFFVGLPRDEVNELHVHRHHFEEGFYFEVYAPIIRTHRDQTSSREGRLRLVKIFGQDFAREINRRTSLRFDYFTAPAQQPPASTLGNILAVNDSRRWAWSSPEQDFSGMAQMALEEGKAAVFRFDTGKLLLDSEIALIERAGWIVLAVMVLFFLPVGYLFMKRTIFVPIVDLVTRVELLKLGHYSALPPSPRSDELGFLTNSFDAMAGAIHERERELKKLSRAVEQSPASVVITDTDGNIEYVNPRFTAVTGYPQSEVLGRNPRLLNSGKNPPELYQELWSTIRAGRTWNGMLCNKRKNGELYWTLSSISPLMDSARNITHFIGVKEDISLQKRAEELLEKERSLLRSLVDSIPDLIFYKNREGLYMGCNKAFEAFTGMHEEALVGKSAAEVLPTDIGASFHENDQLMLEDETARKHEVWVTYPDGRQVLLDTLTTPYYDAQGRLLGLIGVSRDITERKRAEAQIERQAFYDALTDLPNRRLLYDRLSQELARSKRRGHVGAVIFIDLDHFKMINDSLGHYMGDELIKHVAQRFSRVLREEDTAARLGGDEFVIMLSELSDEMEEAFHEAQKVVHKLQMALAEPCKLEGHVLHVSASVGFTLFPDDGHSVDEILKQADIAMYQAKQQGRDTCQFYLPSMQEAASERMDLAMDLRRALANEEFELLYQPQVDAGGRIIGAEALLRWHPVGQGMIGPDKFIPVAEDTGLILPIGEWVAYTAGQHRKALDESLGQPWPGRFSINVSSRQFNQKSFVERLCAIWQRAGVDPRGLELELTETMLLHDLDVVIEKMQALKDLGVRFAVDDFGTGYSSLSYLKRLPVDILKIDQSFVRDITVDPGDAAIVDTIIAMTRHLGLAVIAEGVEKVEELDFLAAKGCASYQGFYFHRPMSFEALQALLSEQGAQA